MVPKECHEAVDAVGECVSQEQERLNRRISDFSEDGLSLDERS